MGQKGKQTISGASSWAFNGGGYTMSPATYVQSGEPGNGGGGGTDISLFGGDWDSINHLYSRIIVAGGGGGGDDNQNARCRWCRRRY